MFSTRATRDLRPGDRFLSVTGKVRTVLTNKPPAPGGDGKTHWLTTDTGALVAQADTRWELLPPIPQSLAEAWDQGEAAGRANAETERRHGTPHLYARNPYRD